MKPVTPRPPVPNAALRELAGRIKSLSYADMLTFAESVTGGAQDKHVVAETLLSAADMLAGA